MICCQTTKRPDFPENYNILQDISETVCGGNCDFLLG